MRISKLIELVVVSSLVAASFVAIVFFGNWPAAQYFVTLGAVFELEEWLHKGSKKR